MINTTTTLRPWETTTPEAAILAARKLAEDELTFAKNAYEKAPAGGDAAELDALRKARFQVAYHQQADLIVENANLRQENTELHELIGVQRQMIDTLQRQARKQRFLLMHAQGATSMLLAALQIPDDDEPTAY